MRLLLFTDLHGNKAALTSVLEKAPMADMIIFAGDLNHHRSDMGTLMKSLSQTGKPCLVVHGNWDDESVLKGVCDKFDNVMFLHKGIYEHDGVLFLGHGGGGFSREDKEFERLWKKFFMKQLAGKRSVLITHMPPYDTKVDSLYGEPRGNKAYRRFLDEHQPVLHVCGHLHENFGKTDKVKKTLVINPGPHGVYVEI